MKIEIQRRLEEAEGKIRAWKEGVNKREREVNQYKGELKKEGEFTVFRSLTVKLPLISILLMSNQYITVQ